MSCASRPYAIIVLPQAPSHHALSRGEVSELADEHDLGSCAARRGSSSLPFPTTQRKSSIIGSDDMIEEFAELIPKSLQDKPGFAFLSGRRAFSGSRDLYLLGTNPGGNDWGDYTISKNVTHALTHEDWSAYRDDCWGRNCTKNRLQRGVLHLFKGLELNAGKVPASEVVFLQSHSVPELEGNFEKLAAQCWPLHQAVIDRLDVKVVACIGKRAGFWVRNRLNAQIQIDEFVEKNKRQWESHSHRNTDGLIVVTLTHVSQASWTNPASDPTMLVKRALIRTDTKHRAEYLARRRKFKPIRIKGEMISDTVIRDREDRT